VEAARNRITDGAVAFAQGEQSAKVGVRPNTTTRDSSAVALEDGFIGCLRAFRSRQRTASCPAARRPCTTLLRAVASAWIPLEAVNFLIDNALSPRWAAGLRAAGTMRYVVDYGMATRQTDEAVLRARRARIPRVCRPTPDFGTLLALREATRLVILFRRLTQARLMTRWLDPQGLAVDRRGTSDVARSSFSSAIVFAPNLRLLRQPRKTPEAETPMNI